MKDRPFLFSAPMVRALLDGTKTQTRRVAIKTSQPDVVAFSDYDADECKIEIENRLSGMRSWKACPYGQPGDRLWVRESFCPISPQDPTYNGGMPIEYDYAATYTHCDRLGDSLGIKKKWKPSIHMPRWASRITLEVTGVRIERLQDISEVDALAEGIEWVTARRVMWRDYSKPMDAAGGYWFADHSPVRAYVLSYRTLWESINGAGSWALNPLVWVVEFKVVKP